VKAGDDGNVRASTVQVGTPGGASVGEKTGKIKEEVGWATGDREVEAKGRVEQKSDDPSEPVDDVTEDTMEDERQAVRKDHHVEDPDAPEADEKERN
jgi:uncharacterized protein YjbJ (UPF0337 family)